MTGLERVDRLVISRRSYAVDPASFSATVNRDRAGDPYTTWSVRAVWFGRRQTLRWSDGTDRGEMETTATVGDLWGSVRTDGTTMPDALAAWDGRYGGNAWARVGAVTGWWSESPAPLEFSGRWQPFLRSMLERYPEIPEGYDGWWRKRPRATGISL